MRLEKYYTEMNGLYLMSVIVSGFRYRWYSSYSVLFDKITTAFRFLCKFLLLAKPHRSRTQCFELALFCSQGQYYGLQQIFIVPEVSLFRFNDLYRYREEKVLLRVWWLIILQISFMDGKLKS